MACAGFWVAISDKMDINDFQAWGMGQSPYFDHLPMEKLKSIAHAPPFIPPKGGEEDSRHAAVPGVMPPDRNFLS